MPKDHHPTRAIQMSVQTSELQIIGVEAKEQLNVSFSLMSIARGNCSLNIKPANQSYCGKFGWLRISIDRPVMNGEIFLQRNNFDRIVECLRYSSPRPVTAVLILDKELVINSVGDLILSEEKHLEIIDLSWMLPLN
ncbi:MAG: hypothetical protein VYE27_03970 [Pseudomonadota bacterium]|nr:hypothetical protein [Pseudomonadota bacterium]